MTAPTWMAFAAVTALACAPSDGPATQVVVLVGGDVRISKLDVRVFPKDGAGPSDKRTISLTRRKPDGLPTSFTIVPGERGGAHEFRLIVQGIASDSDGNTLNLARSEVVARFTDGQTVLLPMLLADSCATESCECDRNTPCARTCEPFERGARCIDTPIFSRLASIVPGTEFLALGVGLGGCASGTLPASDGTCHDLDECAFAIDACTRAPSACVNELPEADRYRCACPAGYLGSGEADDPCVPCPSPGCA